MQHWLRSPCSDLYPSMSSKPATCERSSPPLTHDRGLHLQDPGLVTCLLPLPLIHSHIIFSTFCVTYDMGPLDPL